MTDLKNSFCEPKLRVLVACEESQEVCKAFRELGHEAFSCDILPCSGGHPEWHIQGDVIEHLSEDWDLMIAHPPCTYLTVTGNRWFNPKYKDRFPLREQDRKEAIDFFMQLATIDIPMICIENPIGIMSRLLRKPEQIIQPWMFGHECTKSTCLWLKNLPKLEPTNIVGKGEIITFKSGKRMTKWYSDAFKLPKDERAKLRSKTFPGIAKAMASQWGNLNKLNNDAIDIVSEVKLMKNEQWKIKNTEMNY